jgi:hypothetical protein
MKYLLPAVCAFIAIIGFTAKPPEEPELRLVFTGDIRGYLSPCGCSKPQIGGVLRMAGVVRALKKQPNTLYADLGNWTMAAGRQDELKADALAEVFRSLDPDALNIGAIDAKLGRDLLIALNESTNNRLISSNFAVGDEIRIAKREGATLATIAGLMPDYEAERYGALRNLSRESIAASSADILLFAGSLEEAKALIDETNFAGLVIFSQNGDPTNAPIEYRKATLVSPGDKGRFVGYIERKNGKWTNLRTISLGPEHFDDESAHMAYHAYLERVSSEKLLEAIPRTNELGYVGSEACASCHTDAHAIWIETKHANALETLEKTGNDRDPECVGCHVVGLNAISGFRSRSLTPTKADVGCESCHGPGDKHLSMPYEPYGKAGEASCLPCHNADHSPGFDFKTYWEKIKH